MSATLLGRAAVFGAGGTLTWSGIAATTEFQHQGNDLTDEVDVATLEDPDNDVISVATSKPRRTVTFDIIPTATSGAGNTLANAKTAMTLPAIGTVVTTSAFSSPDLNTTWNYLGGGKVGETKEGWGKLTLPLTRYGAASLAAVS